MGVEYALEFGSPFISATSPTIFARFVLRQLEKADEIMRAIKRAPFANSVSALVFLSTEVFEWPGTEKLKTYLEEEGV